MLAGLVLLAAVGFGGSALFPDACDALEARGDLVLDYAGVGEVLPVDQDTADALEQLGPSVGIEPFRGAVAVPSDARLVASEAGAFVVTDDDLVVLRPGFGVASNALGLLDSSAVPAHDAVVLRGPDGTAQMLDGELEELRCGSVAEPDALLDVDRGITVVREADGAATVTFSGERRWGVALDDVRWAWVVDDEVVLGTGDGAVVLDLDDGEELARIDGAVGERADGDGPRVLLRAPDGGHLVVDVPERSVRPAEDLLPDGLAALVPGSVVGATLEDGLVGLAAPDGSRALEVDRARVVDLVTSTDGVVLLHVEVAGQHAVLQYGPLQLLGGATLED